MKSAKKEEPKATAKEKLQKKTLTICRSAFLKDAEYHKRIISTFFSGSGHCDIQIFSEFIDSAIGAHFDAHYDSGSLKGKTPQDIANETLEKLTIKKQILDAFFAAFRSDTVFHNDVKLVLTSRRQERSDLREALSGFITPAAEAYLDKYYYCEGLHQKTPLNIVKVIVEKEVLKKKSLDAFTEEYKKSETLRSDVGSMLYSHGSALSELQVFIKPFIDKLIDTHYDSGALSGETPFTIAKDILNKIIVKKQIWDEFVQEFLRNADFSANVRAAFYSPGSHFTYPAITSEFVLPMIEEHLNQHYPKGIPTEKTPRALFEDIVKECEARRERPLVEPQPDIKRTNGTATFHRSQSTLDNLDKSEQEEEDGHWSLREKADESKEAEGSGWVTRVGNSLYTVGNTIASILSGKEGNKASTGSFPSLGE